MIRKKSDLVTVIIPIFNAENNLFECLESVINQTYKDIEVLLIDDGSIDNSGKICEEYATKDNRFKVFHIKNSGVSTARNVGLKKSNGEYVTFVDADDKVSIYMIEEMMRIAKNNNAKLVTVNNYYDIRQPFKTNIYSKIIRKSSTTINIEDYNFDSLNAHTVCWGALYHKSIISNQLFETDLFVGEDSYYFANAMLNAKQVTVLDEQLYYYCMNENSLSHGTYNKKRITEIEAWIRIRDLFVDYPRVYRSCKNAIIKRALKGLHRNNENGCLDNEDIDFIKKVIKENISFNGLILLDLKTIIQIPMALYFEKIFNFINKVYFFKKQGRSNDSNI